MLRSLEAESFFQGQHSMGPSGCSVPGGLIDALDGGVGHEVDFRF